MNNYMNAGNSLIAAAGAILALLSWAVVANELSAEEKLARAETELSFSKQALDLNQTCGTSLDVSIEWDGFPENHAEYSVSGYCEAGLDAVSSLCGGENKKAYIADKVTSLQCSYDASRSGTVEVNGGALAFFLEFEESNLTDKFKKALLGSL